MVLFENGLKIDDEILGMLDFNKEKLESMIITIIRRELESRYMYKMEMKLRRNIPALNVEKHVSKSN